MNPPPFRVLVVDDDREDFLILRDLLVDDPQCNYRMEWVSTLQQGIEALRAGQYDVYLVDYMLGPDNGMEILNALVAEGMHRQVIMLTGHGNSDLDDQAMKAGASDYLVKGQIDQENLSRALRYAIERGRQIATLDEIANRYRLLFELNPIPAWAYDLETLRFVSVNDAMVRNYGYSREELLQMTILDVRLPSERERFIQYRSDPGHCQGPSGIWKHRRKDGSFLWVEITALALVLDGRASRLVIANDITARRDAQARLHLLERAVQSTMNSIVITDANESDMPIIYVNPAFERMTGYTAAEAVGRNCRFLQGDERDQSELGLIRHALRNQSECSVIMRNFHKDGTLFWNNLFISPVRDEDGEVTHFVGVLNDLTEQRKIEAELTYTASHDAVTGLSLYPVLELTMAGMIEGDQPVCVFFIDLDRFHAINETMGHVMGDEALRLIADRLRIVTGDAGGHIARFVGDEFVVAVPGLTSSGALALAHALCAAVAEPIEGDTYRLQITASIGISRWPEHGDGAMDLLRRAEAAMTRAKLRGRNGVCEFSVEQMQELEDRLVLGAALREAINRNELELHYQPKVRASDNTLTGFEALLRWNSNELGQVSPARFIPTAEALGLMSEIGEWVLDEACRQARAWLDGDYSRFTVAVNVSAQQLQRPQIVEQVRNAFERYRLPPCVIELELTESSLMENIEDVRDTLSELKALGVSLSLDDFGTGYSSLSYLKQFSLDKLKIDRSFVNDLPYDADATAIAGTIVAIGHQLHMVVVAEGVEAEAQAQFLRKIGCDELQGYLVGYPANALEATRLLGAGTMPANSIASQPDTDG